MSEIFSPAFVPSAKPGPVASERSATRVVLIGIAVAFLALFLVLPLLAVFTQAFSHGRRPSWTPSGSPMPGARSA